MSNRYRATFNVQTSAGASRYAEVEAAYATALQTIDAHCIVERSQWNPTGTRWLFVLTFTYTAASDTEASAIIHDAGVATGLPFDAERITSNGGRREVPADLWQSAER